MNISPHLHTKIFFQRRYILSKSDQAHSPPTSLLTCSVNQSQTKTISAFFKTLHLHSKRWQGEGELVRELTSLCSRYIYNAHSARHASSNVIDLSPTCSTLHSWLQYKSITSCPEFIWKNEKNKFFSNFLFL